MVGKSTVRRDGFWPQATVGSAERFKGTLYDYQRESKEFVHNRDGASSYSCSADEKCLQCLK